MKTDYNRSLKLYGKFSTVEGFWHLYSHMKRSTDLPLMDINVFAEGITPAWEDKENVNGGDWAVRLPPILTAYPWEGLLMAFIGNKIATAPGDTVHGVVLSIRRKDFTISVWNRSRTARSDDITVASIREATGLPEEFSFEYNGHAVPVDHPRSKGDVPRATFQPSRSSRPAPRGRGFGHRPPHDGASSHFGGFRSGAGRFGHNVSNDADAPGGLRKQ